ncbi:hypothetical protein OAF35_00720 [Verrucomicrobiales bacterium]|jgi:hypothetical protein|nr:hypothetical protein [Verrucomicrobiales bacterium]
MARRAQKGINKLIIAIFALCIVSAGFLIVKIIGSPKDSMRTVTQLNVSDYIKEGTSLAGTEGIVTGVVAEKLRWTPDRGEIISVAVNLDKNQELIPIMVPPEFKNVNIARGDKFTFKVEVGKEQILITKDLKRR